jgi:hypothetical protein
MNVDGIDFHFPQGWETAEYDKWRFYRKQFQDAVVGHKGVDVIAINNRNTLWLIELKDYRKHPRNKIIDLAEEVALKVRDTLAGLMAAASNAVDEEKKFAKNCLKAEKIRIALQLEQPQKHSKLFPRAIKPIDVEQKLKKMVKPIDAHPIVTEGQKPRPGIEWQVSLP